MQPLKTLATAAALATALAGPALADDSQLFGVSAIDVRLSGAAPVVTVRNVAANHHLGSLQLAVQENQIAVGVSGYVDCTGTQFENFAQRFGHYLSGGAFGIGRTSLLMNKALPDSSSIDHTGDMDAHTFQMPAALLANPQIAVDPVALVLAAANKAPNKLEWLRQDHVLTVKIPLRWEAKCASYTRNKITKQTIREAAEPSYLTKDVELKIKYEGDPQLFEVNAQLSQGGGLPGQLQPGHQPIKITQMNFQPNMPHHVGACPATTKIRIFYHGEGRGEIRIVVRDNTLLIHNSAHIPFNAANGPQHYDFEIAIPKPAAFNINKTVSHNLSLHVFAKDEKAKTWPSAYKTLDNAVWNHRCTPQLNPALGGTGGAGKPGGFQSGGSQAPTARPRVKQPEPAPASPTLQLKQPAPAPAAPTIQRAQ